MSQLGKLRSRQPTEIVGGGGGVGLQNPMFPFVEFYLGSSETAIPVLDRGPVPVQPGERRHQGTHSLLLKQMTYSVSTSTSGNALTLTLLDPQWTFLEEQLLRHRRDLYFRFGWRSAQDVIASPKQGLDVWSWEPTFKPFQGVTIKIHARDRGFTLTNKPSPLPAVSKDTLVSDAIRQIITAATENVLVDIPIPTVNTVGDLNIAGNRTAQAWVQDLLKHAIGPDGQNLYRIQVEPHSTTNGVTKITVAPLNREKDRVSASYVMGRERAGEMLDFQPKYNGNAVLALGGRFYEGNWMDPKTKTLRTYRSARTESEILAPRTDYPTREVSRAHEFPFSTKEEVAGVVAGQRVWADYMTINGNATVQGHPGLKPGQLIEVLMIRGGRAAQRSLTPADLHGTSGFYYIFDVEHTLTPGSFKTSLNLQRIANYFGTASEGKPVDAARAVVSGAVGYAETAVENLGDLTGGGF